MADRSIAPPWYFQAVSLFVAVAVLLPIVYLIIRAFEADAASIADLIFRYRTFELFRNTVLLAAGVLAVTTLIGYPIAWLLVRSDIKFKGVITLLSVLPLAIPGYMLAYALLGASGSNGLVHQLFGIEIPRLSGYWGALIAISLYTYPYMFLNLKAGLSGLDTSVEEAARSLGFNTRQIFFKVVIPQLRPAYLSGCLIIGLYVLGDFGAVSLMRFETFSYALFLQYAASYDRIYAAWIALIMLSITGVVLLAEYRLLRGIKLHRTGSGAKRRNRISTLGRLKPAVYASFGILFVSALIIPVSTIVLWMSRAVGTDFMVGVSSSFISSISASIPAAFLASILALPLAYLSVRFPSRWSRIFERLAWLGYAIPPLALSLAFIFFSLQAAPWLYQTLILLILCYSVHFMAEALGPIRSALYQAPPRLEDAARSLGLSPFAAFVRVTLPMLRNGTITGAAFVFISCMKELPMAFLLAPIGFETLAVEVWSYSNEGMFAQAAPFAMTILTFSGIFVGILFSKEWSNQ